MRRKPLFPPPLSAATGKRKRHKGRQPYRIVTINGYLRLWRVRWHCTEEGSETPTDALLDEAEQTISEGAREMACRVNQSCFSFKKAADTLRRTARVEISKETLRQLVESEGRTVARMMRQAKLVPTWSAKDCVAEQKPAEDCVAEQKPAEDCAAKHQTAKDCVAEQQTTRVYGGLDGVMAPLVTDEEKKKRRQKIREKRRLRGRKCKPLPRLGPGADSPYKEFRVAHLYDETMKHRLVGVTSGNHEVAGRLLKRLADQVELHKADERIALVDGAPWIRNQIEFHGLTENIGLDFWHLKENVHKARRAVFGEANPQGTEWLSDLMHTFKHDGYSAAWEKLVEWRKSLRGPKRAAADCLLNYVAQRQDMIRYPEFRTRGWNIGNGPTESECNTTMLRIKGRHRWDSANAEAIAALAALEDSDMWHKYWPTLDPQRN